MKVIGAGFGRTGTLSLKTALEALGFGPCYHMAEVFAHPEHVPTWEAAGRGEPVDWARFFEGWTATVDWPACNFYKEILAAHPDAKVLLSVRDPERWYQSCIDTIYSIRTRFPLRLLAPLIPRMGPMHKMAHQVVWKMRFDDRFEDKAHAIAVFEAHIAAVKRAVPADRLLVFDVKQGWGPLCEFLGVPAPDQPFPHVNDSAEMKKRIRGMNLMAWALLITPLAALTGLAAWLLR